MKKPGPCDQDALIFLGWSSDLCYGIPYYLEDHPRTWSVPFPNRLNDLNCLWKGGYQPLPIWDDLPSIGFNDHSLPQQTYGNSDPSKAHPAMNKDSHQGKISGKSSENYRNSFYHLVFFSALVDYKYPQLKTEGIPTKFGTWFPVGISYTLYFPLFCITSCNII